MCRRIVSDNTPLFEAKSARYCECISLNSAHLKRVVTDLPISSVKLWTNKYEYARHGPTPLRFEKFKKTKIKTNITPRHAFMEVHHASKTTDKDEWDPYPSLSVHVSVTRRQHNL